RLLADHTVAHVFARIGSPESTEYTEPSNSGELQIALRPGVGVNALDRLARRIESESRLPGVQLSIDTPTFERVGESLSGLSQPFVISVFGSDLSQLRRLSLEITARLR